MSKEQAKGFFEAISKDKQLADEVKEVVRGQATNQEKAKELLSLAKAHNFNFTEDELKRSLSREDLADIAGGSELGQAVVSGIMASTLGLGGTPAPLQLPIEQPAAIVRQQAGNAQNQGENQDGENETPPAANVDEDVNEIRERTPEEIAEDQQREEQRRHEIEARLAQGPLELGDTQAYFDGYGDRYGDQLAEAAREVDDNELRNRINQLNTLYYRLLYAPQSQELMDRIRNYIATVGFTFDSGTASLQEQISIADALIHEAEKMLQSAEQQRGEEIREEIQQGLDTLALILQRTHTGLPGENELALEIQKFLAMINDDFTDENLEGMNSLLDRARDMMLNRAREHSRFDTDQEHIRNNDLQLAQMLGIDKEYIQEKIKNKIKMSANDITGTIELPDGDTVTFNFMVGSGTLVLTGTGNTVIENPNESEFFVDQLKEAGIVFKVADAFRNLTEAQLPTPNNPWGVRNLIIGDGIIGVGRLAFVDAVALRSVYFLGAVRSIESEAFFTLGGSHLHEVGFAQPETLERIDKRAFQASQSLLSINIPQNADIHESAFLRCDKLKKQGCPYCKSSK